MAMAPSELQQLWRLCFDSEEGSETAAVLGSDTVAASDAVAVVASDALDCLDDDAALLELGRLTSMLVPQIVWLRREPADAMLKDRLRALGFVPAGNFAERFAYAYDLARSNQPREWNSPENWANPSQFNKRW